MRIEQADQSLSAFQLRQFASFRPAHFKHNFRLRINFCNIADDRCTGRGVLFIRDGRSDARAGLNDNLVVSRLGQFADSLGRGRNPLFKRPRLRRNAELHCQESPCCRAAIIDDDLLPQAGNICNYLFLLIYFIISDGRVPTRLCDFARPLWRHRAPDPLGRSAPECPAHHRSRTRRRSWR